MVRGRIFWMNTMQNIWRTLHRWLGLGLIGFTLFYGVTGVLLNHRQGFDYFQRKEKSVSTVSVSDTALLRQFIDTYKQQIGRSDDPAVIRIRDEKIELLYGSHGRTTYVVDPARGTMERIDKFERQPWSWLNGLHKVAGTSTSWLALADLAGLGLLFLVASGLLLLRFRPLDYLLTLAGLVLLGFGLWLA